MAIFGALIWGIYVTKKLRKISIYINGIIVLSIACKISLLLAPEAKGVMVQKTGSMMILIPVLICVIVKLL